VDSSALSSLPAPAFNYNDLSGLQSLNALAKADKAGALEQVARQFESFFVAQLLKGMRSANAIFAEDDPMNSNEMQFRQEMLDQQLSLSLTKGRGLGLAAIFARQLRQQLGGERDDKVANDNTFDQSRLIERDGRKAASVPAARIEPQANGVPMVMRRAMQLLEPVLDDVRDAVASVREETRFDDKHGFVAALLPHARRVAQLLGVDHRVLIAQAALETGWGRAIIKDERGRSSHNLFNIKAGSFWAGRSVGARTIEFSGGLPGPQRAMFRAYESFADSMSDFADLLLNSSRYRRALDNAHSAPEFVRGLQLAGYATDPDYAAKVLRVLDDDAIASAP
jgi:peptidoglycan hydrolase FlgJ